MAGRDAGSQAGSYRKVGRKQDGQGNRQTDRKTTRQVGSKQACWNADMTEEHKHVGQADTQVDKHAGKLAGRDAVIQAGS